MSFKNIAVVSDVGVPDRVASGGALRSTLSLAEYSKHFNIFFIQIPNQQIDDETYEYLLQEIRVKRIVNLEFKYFLKKTLGHPRLGFIYPLIPKSGFNIFLRGLNDLENLQGVVTLNEPLDRLSIGRYVKEKLHVPSIALLQLPVMYSSKERVRKLQEAWDLWYNELYANEGIRKKVRELRTSLELSVMQSRFVKNLVNSYDVLIGVSKSILIEMGEDFSNKFYPLDPGISLNDEDIKLIETLRKMRSEKENYIVLGGRIDALKGFVEGIYAFREFSRIQPSFKLIVTGYVSDSLKSRINGFLKRMGLKERVILTGQLSRRDRFDIIRKARLMLYPSHVDSFSYAVLEALHLGTPVVGYDIPALRVHYSDSQGVFLVKEGDIDALVSKVVEIIGEKNVETCPPVLPSWKDIIEKEVSIINRVIS